jgi:hypothetical protein
MVKFARIAVVTFPHICVARFLRISLTVYNRGDGGKRAIVPPGLPLLPLP